MATPRNFSSTDAGRAGAGRLGLGVAATATLAAGAYHLAAAFFPGLGASPLEDKVVDPALKLFAVSLIAWVLLRSGDVLRFKFGDKEFEVRREVVKVAETANDTATTLKAEVDGLKKRLAELEARRDLSDLLGRKAKLRAATQSFGAPPSALESAVAEPEKPAPPAKAASKPMPVLKPPTTPGDINKGRFGGLATRDGYVLSATFAAGGADDPLAPIELFVRRVEEPPLTETVHFFLHDSFVRRELVFPAVDGEASTGRLLVWGGFTVGAWIEGTDVLLELDLALEPNAPRVIRTK
ncbi:MAG: hypothetical protein LWW93_01125 [Hyphomicrobiales bacterium]|nr:hypothetical protein [Hyphomicrobiales bacterium]